jgi:uncharacterized protein (DUF302 family)
MTMQGVVTIKSNFGYEATVEQLESTLKAKGMALFAHIDHAAGAKQAGLELRPTGLVIFGSPKAGTPLMQENQMVGLDLPLKALIWRDERDTVWLTYNDPRWIAKRYGLGAAAVAQADAMAAALAAVVKQATGT